MIDIDPVPELDEAQDTIALAEEPSQPEKTPWETPRMEDVSDEVMAQPYIRFT